MTVFAPQRRRGRYVTTTCGRKCHIVREVSYAYPAVALCGAHARRYGGRVHLLREPEGEVCRRCQKLAEDGAA